MKAKSSILLSCVVMMMCNLVNSQTTVPKSSSIVTSADSLVFNTLLTKYTQSINEADTTLAAQMWAKTSEISFITPSGNEYGWSGVKNIYKIFHDYFTKRKLSFSKLNIAVYDGFAWLEFHWVFDGTLVSNNSAVQTKGRETQIWRKLNNEWRLVHIHYSGMPVSNQE